VLAEGLRTLLQDAFEVLATVYDGEALLLATLTLAPDVVVTDLTMPRLGGLEALREIVALHLPVKILVLTMHAEPIVAEAALHAGASGYLLKDSPPEEIRRAIQTVATGKVYLPSFLARSRSASRSGAPAPVAALTPRLREILYFTAKGWSMKKVAAELGISRRTAESHKQRLMKVLNVHTTADLVRHAAAAEMILTGSSRIPSLTKHKTASR
jgi:DNA-binding NarL/FixJ family response regulator